MRMIGSVTQCKRFGIVASGGIISPAAFLVVHGNSRKVLLLLLPVWNKNTNVEYILF